MKYLRKFHREWNIAEPAFLAACRYSISCSTPLTFWSRNKTEQRIHEVTKLESMDDNEFEGFPEPAAPNHPMVGHIPHLEMEQDPLFDPLSIPGDDVIKQYRGKLPW